jgi:hypothetical protein
VLPVDATSWNTAELAILTWQKRNTKKALTGGLSPGGGPHVLGNLNTKGLPH